MVSKAECFEIIKVLRKKAKNGTLSLQKINDWVSVETLGRIIEKSRNTEDAYIKLGKTLAESDSYFEKINFREDCYDYLKERGLKQNEAYSLMEVIRKGQYRFEKYQIQSDKLPQEFYEWAKGVKYLPSRKVVKNMIETKTLYKSFVIENYYDDYYEKLKDSLPERIKNGEIEWIYSYGEKLISDGNRCVLLKVREIVRNKNFDNPYISPDMLSRKCKKIIDKYGM